MDDPGSRLLWYVNRVRAVQELEPLGCLVMLGAEAGDEDGCILAKAMQCAVGGARDSEWAAAGRWVLRLRDRWTARIVALEIEQEWDPEHFEVDAPELLVDFAVAFEWGQVERDEFGFVRAWRVPVDGDDLSRGMHRFELPGMGAALPPGRGPGVLPVR